VKDDLQAGLLEPLELDLGDRPFEGCSNFIFHLHFLEFPL
jgi:hypothetical protein